MILEHCQVSASADPAEPLGFVVHNVHDRTNTYTFIAADAEELRAWSEAVQIAAERARAKRDMHADELRAIAVNSQQRVGKSGWCQMKGKRRYVVLRDVSAHNISNTHKQDALSLTSITAITSHQIYLYSHNNTL